MDTHIHNNYNFFFNIIIHLMVFKNYNFIRFNINNDGQPNPGSNNITPEDVKNINDNNNMNAINNNNNIIPDNNEINNKENNDNNEDNKYDDIANDINTNENAQNLDNSNNANYGNNDEINNNNEISTMVKFNEKKIPQTIPELYSFINKKWMNKRE